MNAAAPTVDQDNAEWLELGAHDADPVLDPDTNFWTDLSPDQRAAFRLGYATAERDYQIAEGDQL